MIYTPPKVKALEKLVASIERIVQEEYGLPMWMNPPKQCLRNHLAQYFAGKGTKDMEAYLKEVRK